MKTLRIILATAVFLFLAVSFASAQPYLTQSTVTPDTPTIASGIPVALTSTITIVPQGATTFPRDNMLQLSTSLDGAYWNAQVINNGHQAAVFNQAGPTLFINGYLLSYPSTNSLSINIQLTGTAPAVSSPQQSGFLTVVELNNVNAVVPGTTLSVTREVVPAGSQPTAPPTVPPTTVATTTPASAVPGFSLVGAVIALGIVGIVLYRKHE